MQQQSTERRIHRVYVTRNTEYHVRRDRCIAVKDRRSGDWLVGHLALNQSVRGSLRFLDSGAVDPNEGTPRLGDSLFFYSEGRDLVTSLVVAIERPPRDVVTQYKM